MKISGQIKLSQAFIALVKSLPPTVPPKRDDQHSATDVTIDDVAYIPKSVREDTK
jgi:hypothetical protein